MNAKYENPELLTVGSIQQVVLGAKDGSPDDIQQAQPEPTVLDVD
jgi:hypothetical protein